MQKKEGTKAINWRIKTMAADWKQRIYDSYMSNGFEEAHNRNKEFEMHNRYFRKNYLKFMRVSCRSVLLLKVLLILVMRLFLKQKKSSLC